MKDNNKFQMKEMFQISYLKKKNVRRNEKKGYMVMLRRPQVPRWP